jgi:hypothetical protein
MILIDTGNGSSSLLQYPPLSTLGIPCILPSPPNSSTRTDVSFTGNGPSGSTLRIGIEVKKLTELVGALDTGRLQATQLPGLMALYDIRWLLIVTGSSRRNPKSGTLQTRRRAQNGEGWEWCDWTHGSRGKTYAYSYFQKFLLSPSFTEYKDASGEGIRFDKVYDLSEAAYWIGDLYETWQKPYHRHSSMRVLDRSGNQNGLTESTIRAKLSSLHDPRLHDAKFAQRVRTASSLPGVSYSRAVALAESTESVQKMISPLCKCKEKMGEEERREWEEREDRVWSEVKTEDQDTRKKRRFGSIGKEIGKAVR